MEVHRRVSNEGHEGEKADYLVDVLTAGLRAKLERLYEEDMPLARLRDSSDFIVRAEGDAARVGHFRAQAVSFLIDNARVQTRRIADALASMRGQDKAAAIELAVAGFAPGSIMVGFVLESIDDQVEMPVNRGYEDDILDVLSQAKSVILHDEPTGVLADPIIRDVAMQAIASSAPKQHSRIDRVSIRVGDREAIELTQGDRVELQKRMRAPKKKSDRVMRIEGIVRELDLDAGRFHVRHIDGEVREVRCLVPEKSGARFDKSLLDKRVAVRGAVELSARGNRAMMWVEDIEALGEAVPSDRE